MRRDICIRLRGGMLEKLLDIAVENGAAFASLQRKDARTILLSCDIRSADILITLCRKYKIDAKILHLRGLYALSQRIKARWTLIPALAAALIATVFFLGRIWVIDIAFTGPNASAGNAEKILAFIEKSGIHPGVSSAGIQKDALEKQLLAETGDFSFIGVRIQGVRLLVEASPEVPSPDIYDIGGARDLVAARDGVIESIEVRSGTACVNAGDTVRKGQVLILGEEQKSAEETTAVSALGEVYARSWFEGSASLPRYAEIKEKTGNVRVSKAIRLFSWRVPLKECESFPSEICEMQILPIIGLYLPLEIETCLHCETRVIRKPVDESAALRQAEALARADALSKINIPSDKYAIRESWLDKNITDRTIGLRAVYEISTDIAVSRDALAKEDY